MTVVSISKASYKAMLFTVICHFFVTAVYPQLGNSKNKENFDVRKFRIVSIDIPSFSDSLILKNINGIQVIDARADTAFVGFMQKKIYSLSSGFSHNMAWDQAEPTANKTPTFVRFRNGCRKETTLLAGKYLVFDQNDSLPSILMVVKKLWLSDELNIKAGEHAADRLKEMDNHGAATSGIDVQIEFFLNDKGSYFPMYRFDSVISEHKTVSAYAPEYISTALRASLQKMRLMDEKTGFLKTRRSFSLDEITTRLRNQFNIPALTDTVRKKGVYMTFNEFKDNSPSQTDFEVRTDKLTDNIYIKQPDGEELAARNIWGYSDGENAFVKSVNNFFILQRSQNAFYIFGAKSMLMDEYQTSAMAGYTANGSGPVLPVTFTRSKTAIQLEPFQLDWSSGKLY